MAINRVYAPPLRGLANIARQSGAADQQLQYDQLRQRGRLARMQLQGQYDQQRIQNQSNMDRMVLGAQLQGQENAQNRAYQRADYEDRFTREMQARQQSDQQNALQAQALQQGNQAFQISRDEASVAAQAERDQRLAMSGLLARQEQERMQRQADDDYQRNVIGRLNADGQAKYAQARKLRSDTERVFSEGKIAPETYESYMRQANQMEQGLNSSEMLIPQGNMPGDIITESGAKYQIGEDGKTKEFMEIDNFPEYAKAKGQVIGYLGDEPLYSAPLPSRSGSVRAPVNDPRVELVEAEKKRYADEVKRYEDRVDAYEDRVQSRIDNLMKERKGPNDSFGKPTTVPGMDYDEAEKKARAAIAPPSPVSWKPREITDRPASELAAELDPAGTAAANAAAAGWGQNAQPPGAIEAAMANFDPGQRGPAMTPEQQQQFNAGINQFFGGEVNPLAPPPAQSTERQVDPNTGVIKNPNVLDDMRQFNAILTMGLKRAFPEAITDEERNNIAANLAYPRSREERDAIPSGKFYVTPEGYIFQKK